MGNTFVLPTNLGKNESESYKLYSVLPIDSNV
jgi:hypothetical protein